MDEVTLNMLCFEEDNSWVCIVLEMDIYGHGDTPELAAEDAKDLVAMQLSFAQHKNDPDLAWRSAPMEYMTLYSQLRANELRDRASRNARINKDYRIGGLPMPAAHVIAELSKGYTLANA